MTVLNSPKQMPDEPRAAAATKSPGRLLLGLLLAAVSAALLFMTYDGHGGLWPLTLVAFVPMYVAQYRLLPRKWSSLALAIAAFGWWLPIGLSAESILGIVVVVLLSALFAGLWGVIGIWERPFSERTRYRWFLIQLPLIWVAAEIIFQSNLLLGSLFWYAYRLAPVPQLIQPVSLVSTPALSFLLLMINAAIALALLRWIDGRWPQLATVPVPRRTVKWSAIIAAALAVVWVASSLLLYSWVSAALGPQVRVAMIQTGRDNTTFNPDVAVSPELAQPDHPMSVALRDQLTQMTQAAAADGAKLAVWPEEGISYDVRGADGNWIRDLATSQDLTIVVGFMTDYPAYTTPNMAAVFLPDGTIGEYYKIHPVIAMAEAFDTPIGYPVFDTPFGRMGVQICFDHDFPNSTTRIDALEGAQMVAVVSADPPSLANLRWQSVVFRAVENRTAVVKDNIGYSSVAVNPNGDIAARTVDGVGPETTNLLADVHLGPLGAPFTHTGGYPFGLLVIVGLIARYGTQIVLRRRDGALP